MKNKNPLSNNGTRSSVIIAFLLDGKAHRFSEFRDYLYRKMDPRLAVKCYLRHFRKKELPPVGVQIEKGRKQGFRETLGYLVESDIITAEETGVPGSDDFILQLTEVGKKTVRLESGRNAICGRVMASVGRMFQKGDLELATRLSDKASNGIVPEDFGEIPAEADTIGSGVNN